MFKKIWGMTTLLALALIAAKSWATDDNQPAQALAGLIANLNTYQADFEQRVNNEYGEEIDFSAGAFSIQRPDHFRWEIKEQFPQVIVADGDHLWTYDQDLEQVTIQNQLKMLADSPLLLLTSTAAELAEAFAITQVPLEGKDGDNHLFLLKPKNESSVFDSVNILFEDRKLTELLMADTLGQKTTVQFSNIKLNEPLASDLFSFEIPEGVDVVDSRESVAPASDVENTNKPKQ